LNDVLNVVLYEPEIPPNTGNIIRLCANTGAALHLVGPMGFVLDDARVRRAGLDYHDMANVSRYDCWESFTGQNGCMRLWAFSTRGSKRYDLAEYHDGDGLLFGPETRGLPDQILESTGFEQILRVPMQMDNRSLNLSNTVAIGLYEALRQISFDGLQ
jgi:tRNA (cytidine/uridine-2'-O-)-methyltransferase